ncbi:MAG: sugar ABC transporter permease [Actinomycetota bacterium]|nr:sugar ABC transporter permease [Actinomycetota bacterium]
MIVVFFLAFSFLRSDDANKLAQVGVALVAGVLGVWVLYWAMDRVVDLLPGTAAAAVRPFVFVGPAMVLVTVYLVYPTVQTTIFSFQDSDSEGFVGLDNYVRIFTESQYLVAIRNSLLWVLIVPAAAVIIGLAFATLADRLGKRSEAAAKSLIFLPMAISFVGASAVWVFMYSFRPEGFGEQIGLLNAVWTVLGGQPVDWLGSAPLNNLFLMVILSSAIKSVPDDLLEAARIDGATEWQVFTRVTLPSVASTITVVWTTTVITVWKVFDIVYVMTGGFDGTQVVAQQMVQEFFTNRNNGVGAALAVLLFVAVIPVLIINVKRFREQEAMR